MKFGIQVPLGLCFLWPFMWKLSATWSLNAESRRNYRVDYAYGWEIIESSMTGMKNCNGPVNNQKGGLVVRPLLVVYLQWPLLLFGGKETNSGFVGPAVKSIISAGKLSSVSTSKIWIRRNNNKHYKHSIVSLKSMKMGCCYLYVLFFTLFSQAHGVMLSR